MSQIIEYRGEETAFLDGCLEGLVKQAGRGQWYVGVEYEGADMYVEGWLTKVEVGDTTAITVREAAQVYGEDAEPTGEVIDAGRDFRINTGDIVQVTVF